jgi:hypothetical protein
MEVSNTQAGQNISEQYIEETETKLDWLRASVMGRTTELSLSSSWSSKRMNN